MDLISDLQNTENPLDAYIKKMEGEIKTFKHDVKKNAKELWFCRFCLFPENKKVYQLFFVAVRLQR